MIVASDDLAIRVILIDLLDAIARSGLSDLEYKAIRAVYMDDPTPPLRTGASHRPAGGSTRNSVAISLGICRDTLWKTLNSAIEKIDTTLNYEGKNEISTSTMRNL